MTSSTRLLQQKLLINQLLAKRGRKGMGQGFTLVELIVVIVIVGILGALSLPNFLGVRDKAAAGAQIGSMQGFSKQCATEQLTGGGSLTVAEVAAAGATLSAVCAGSPVTMRNTTPFVAGRITGLVCGRSAAGATQAATAASTICTLTIGADGTITGAWS